MAAAAARRGLRSAAGVGGWVGALQRAAMRPASCRPRLRRPAAACGGLTACPSLPPSSPPARLARSDEITRWVKKKTGPATTEVADADALAAARKESKVVVLALFDKFEGDAHAAYEAGKLLVPALAVLVPAAWAGLCSCASATEARSRGSSRPSLSLPPSVACLWRLQPRRRATTPRS